MAFANAPAAWLNGVTVAAADIDASTITGAKIATGTVSNANLAGSITAAKLAGSIGNDKLTNAYVEMPIISWQGTAAAGTHLGKVQLTAATKITEICFACSMNGTASSSSIDLNGGPNVASGVTLFGAGTKLIIKDGSTLKVAAPSGTLGTIADNGVVWFDIDTVASGTKSNWNITVMGRVALRALS